MPRGIGFHADGQRYQPQDWPLARSISRGEVVKDKEIDFLRGDSNRGNAIEFTPQGGQITVRLERTNQQAQIQIIDTGIGISADFLPYVFDRFRQAENATTRSNGGLGLNTVQLRI